MGLVSDLLPEVGYTGARKVGQVDVAANERGADRQ